MAGQSDQGNSNMLLHEDTQTAAAITLDYVPADTAPCDPAAREVCDIRCKYNQSTIVVRHLEHRTPYPVDAATAEVTKLQSLLQRIADMRTDFRKSALPATDRTAIDDSQAVLELDLQTLRKVILDEIDLLKDTLELHAQASPSSDQEVSSTFDPGGDSYTDTMEPSPLPPTLPPSVVAKGNDDGIETAPHDEQRTHRGILFHPISSQHPRDPIDNLHMLGLLALVAHLLEHDKPLLAAASTCVPPSVLPSSGLSDLATLHQKLELEMRHQSLDLTGDDPLSAADRHHFRLLRKPKRLNVCCNELIGKLPTIVFHALRTHLQAADLHCLEQQILNKQQSLLGVTPPPPPPPPDTAVYVAECAQYLKKRLDACFTSATRLCEFSRNACDVQFATEHLPHGGEIRNSLHQVVGYVLYDGQNKPYAIKAVDCLVTLHQRGANTQRCANCVKVGKIVYDARRNDQTRVGSPRLKRKLSFADHAHVKHLRTTNSKLRKQIQKLSEKLRKALQCVGSPSYSGSDAMGRATVALRPIEENDLIKAVHKAIESGRLAKDSWLYRDIYFNIKACAKKDLRGLRYSPEQVAYWQSMRFLGGSRVVEEMRGPISEGAGNKGGRLPNNASENVRRYVPSVSTLNQRSPPLEVYPALANNAAQLARALDAKQTAKVGGISFDAIAISRGYTYVEHLAQLIGAKSTAACGSGAIPLKAIKDHTLEKLRDAVGSHVLQLFWTSLDGRASTPIGYIVTQGDDPAEMASAVGKAIDRLEEHGIRTVFTASDGFIGCADFVSRMEKWVKEHPSRSKQLPLVHVFDYVHVLKCIRNRLLNAGFTLADGTVVMMKDLARIWADAAAAAAAASAPLHSTSNELHDEWRKLKRDLFSLLKEDDVVPSDKMAWATVKNLFAASETLRKLLPKDPVANGLATFFERMKDYYYVFSGDAKMTAAERLSKLEPTIKWFCCEPPKGKIGLTPELSDQLRTTLASLRVLVQWQESTDHPFWPSRKAHPIFSFLSTNVVENFFSIIRSKFRYPSLLMYATAYHGAYHYLVWRLSPDSGCPQFKAPIGAAYGNVGGIQFSFKTDIRSWSPAEKAGRIKEIYAENRSGLTDAAYEQTRQTALEVCSRLRPTRKVLTIREATCKKRPGRCHLILCEALGCPRMFTYAGCYVTHKLKCHPDLVATPSPDTTMSITLTTATTEPPSATAEGEAEEIIDEGGVTAETGHSDWAVVGVDVETTGRSNTSRIVQLAARTANGLDSFVRFVRPPASTVWEHGAIKVTGINQATVSQAGSFAEVLVDFLAWLQQLGAEEILFFGHNSLRFDRQRFVYEFSLLSGGGRELPTNWHWADTLHLARRIYPGQPASLEELCKRFGVTNQKAHDAMSDVNALWDVVKNLLYAGRGQQTADADAEQCFLECYALSPTFKQLPAFIQVAAAAAGSKKKRQQCPSCKRTDHFAKSSAKCPLTNKRAAPTKTLPDLFAKATDKHAPASFAETPLSKPAPAPPTAALTEAGGSTTTTAPVLLSKHPRGQETTVDEFASRPKRIRQPNVRLQSR